MPQIPMLIPLVVTGIVVGSMLKSETHRISKKKLAAAAVLSGVLNGGQAYLVYLITPTPTIPATASTFIQSSTLTAFRGTSEIDFAIASIFAGILIVLVIVGIAMLYARRGGGAEEEEESSDELTNEK
jgi:hypothetical protein